MGNAFGGHPALGEDSNRCGLRAKLVPPATHLLMRVTAILRPASCSWMHAWHGGPSVLSKLLLARLEQTGQPAPAGCGPAACNNKPYFFQPVTSCQMYRDDGLSEGDMATLLRTFPNQTLDFFGALR